MFYAFVLSCCALLVPIHANVYQFSCGRQKINTVFLVHHGMKVNPGEWPWHAAIYRTINKKVEYACGGSIIDRRTILTAAHCFFLGTQLLHENAITVRVGQVNLNEPTDSLQVLNVSKLIIRPEFSVTAGVDHDIALMKLSSDITMTRFVQPVCLWSTDDELGQIVGRNATLAGFGLNEQDELSGILLKTTLTVVDFITCLQSANDTYRTVLTGNMFCAGGKDGASPCNGDSGGGLIFEKDDTWYVRGIVSFIGLRANTKLCDPTKYTVFIDVNKYREWILEAMDAPIRPAQLQPCETGTIPKDALCNVAGRFDHSFLLVDVNSSILRLTFNGDQKFTIANFTDTYGMAHDCVEGRIYWGNRSDGHTIVSTKYDGTDRKPFVVEDITDLTDISLDWISRRLYWVDSEKEIIEVASLENPGVRTVLIEDGVSPLRIAVDPLRGKLYWTTVDDSKSKIVRSNLDGTERQLLVAVPQIRQVEGIRVSLATGELCYADGGTGKIECIDPNTKQIRTIASNLYQAFGLAVTDDMFYWTDQATSTIGSINLHDVRQTVMNFPADSELYWITAVTDKCPFYTSPCAVGNGGCPEGTICLVNQHAPSGKNCTLVRNRSDAK